MSQRAVDAEAFLAMVEPPVNISEPDFGPLIGLDGGYASVTVEATRFYAIDPDAPSAAIGLDTLYGPSGEGGWYGYDGFGASDNAGPGRWLAAFVSEDWDTGDTYRLELYLLDETGSVIASSFPLVRSWGTDQQPYLAKVYRWGDVNLILFLGNDDASGDDAVFGMLVSTDGDSISAGAPQLLMTIAYPGFSFAAASDTEGAVVAEKSGEWVGWSFVSDPNAEVIRLTRSGLALSVGPRSSFFIGTGWVNGIAHHGGDVYIVAHESFTDPEFGNSRVARAVSPGSGVITSIALSGSGAPPYLGLQNNNIRGDHVVKHSGGFASVWSSASGNFAERIAFDGATLVHSGTITGQARTTAGREAQRTAHQLDGWLSVGHDRYWLWSEDFTSIVEEGAFTNLRGEAQDHFPTQLPDTP